MKSNSTTTSSSSSSSSSPSSSSQMCQTYNQNTCKPTSTSQSSFSPSPKTCQYCCYPVTSQKMSSHEDVIKEISKRIVITSMSFPNSKSEQKISITRQNLNNITQLQDMQHISVYVMPLPLCFRDYILTSCCRDQFNLSSQLALSSSDLQQFTLSSYANQQGDAQDCRSVDDNEYNIDFEMNQQFYEELPSIHNNFSSQTIADDDAILDSFRRSGLTDSQQQNHIQFSTRSSSNKESNKNKDYNPHLSISSSNNQARFIRSEEDISQGNHRLISTDVSQILSGQSLSVHEEGLIGMMEETVSNPIKKQKGTQEQKQYLNVFEGMLQKRVKLNQDPLSNINHAEQFCNNRKKYENSSNICTLSSNQLTSFKSAKNTFHSSPLINSANSSISYEHFVSELEMNSSGQNNKINQLNNQSKQDCTKQILIKAQKSKIQDEESDKDSFNFGIKSNKKSNNKSIFQNCNFNQALNEIPDFLGSDSELMKSTLSQVQSPNSLSYKTQQLNFNKQTPLIEQQQSKQVCSSPTQSLTTINSSKQPQSSIDQLKDELRAQLLLEYPGDKRDIKEKYLKRLYKSNKDIKKERRSRINEQNIELIMKLDNELQIREKQKFNESNCSNHNFEDQSTRHTCSLRSTNNTPQKLSSDFKKQITINRVLRFLDDSLLTQSEDLQQRIKKNKEELEQLCFIIYTYSKTAMFSSKAFTVILNETTKQMNNRFFLTKDHINSYFLDLQKIFPNWISIEETSYGKCFKINQFFKFRQVKNFFKQQ